MYDNLENITIKKAKPIIWIPLTILFLVISIPIYIILLAIAILVAPPLLLLIIMTLIINQLMLMISRYIVRIKLKPIVEESKSIYNIDIIHAEHIIYYKNNNFTSIKIPIRFKNIPNAIKKFKEETGSLDNSFLKKIACKSTAINYLKRKKGNVFFSTINYNKEIKKNIHLYDLSSLDTDELKSLKTIDLSDEQKFLLYKKYCLDKI